VTISIMVIKSGMRWAQHIARTGDVRNAYIISIGQTEVKRPLGRPRSR